MFRTGATMDASISGNDAAARDIACVSANPYMLYTRDEAERRIDAMTEWFDSLDDIVGMDAIAELYDGLAGRVRMMRSSGIDKYLLFGKQFGYRIVTGKHAYRSSCITDDVRKFISVEDRCVAMPSRMQDGRVCRITFRSVFSKSFRSYTPVPHIPHGLLFNDKPYSKPWLVVESAFDSDWLRQMYPHVIATGGVSGLNRESADIVANTAPVVVLAFDNDDAGTNGMLRVTGKLCEHRSGLLVYQMRSPYGKDFGDIAQLMCSASGACPMYDTYMSVVLDSMRRFGMC